MPFWVFACGDWGLFSVWFAFRLEFDLEFIKRKIDLQIGSLHTSLSCFRSETGEELGSSGNSSFLFLVVELC